MAYIDNRENILIDKPFSLLYANIIPILFTFISVFELIKLKKNALNAKAIFSSLNGLSPVHLSTRIAYLCDIHNHSKRSALNNYHSNRSAMNNYLYHR